MPSLEGRREEQPHPGYFISAFGDTHQKVKGFEAGGVDYITKPFEAEEVLARVERICGCAAGRALLNAQGTGTRVQERTAELRPPTSPAGERRKNTPGIREIEALSLNWNYATTICRKRSSKPKRSAISRPERALEHIISQIDVVAPTEAGAHPRRDGHRQRVVAHEIHRAARAKMARWFASIARPFRASCSTNSSATSKARSPAP